MIKISFSGIVLLLFSAFLALSCHFAGQQKRVISTDVSRDERILKAIDNLLVQKQYTDAYRYLNLMQKNRTHSPFADDIAYRLAYLRVTADSANPYFNYEAALRAFRQFRKDFPRSRYSSACNNWLKILYLLFDFKKRCAYESQARDELQKTVYELQRKNTRLQRTLNDLEEVIKRKE